MAVKVIEAHRNEHVLENIERRGEALDEVINQVIIRVSAIMEQSPEGSLPFLRLQHAVRVRLIAEEAFKVVFPYWAGMGAGRELKIDEVCDQVSARHKPDFRI